MEYHAVIVPLVPWEIQGPNSFEELTVLMKTVRRLFSFNLSNLPKENENRKKQGAGDATEETSRALLSNRLQHTLHEAGRMLNVTDIVKDLAKEEFETLKIEEAWASDFAVEIISSSEDILGHWQDDFEYNELITKLCNVFYDCSKPFNFAVSIVACKIILCESNSDLKKLANQLELMKIGKHVLYAGTKKPEIRDNMFNFVRRPWSEIFISNPIATLKPELLQEQDQYNTLDELDFLVAMVHALGKFYVISESCRAIRANLEWSTLYLDDLFEKFESKYCWFQRNFSNIMKDLRRTEIGIKSEIADFTRYASSPESVTLIQQVYGIEYFPYVDSFLELLDRFNLENYKIKGDDLKRAVFDDIKSLSLDLGKFLKEFSASANSWKELHNSKVNNNQVLLAVCGLFIPLLVSTVLQLLLALR
jgi:hypothetical protein